MLVQPGRQVLGPPPPLAVLGQQRDGEHRDVLRGHHEHAVMRSPHLDQRGVLPVGRLRSRHPGVDRQQRGPGHAVLEPGPRGLPQRARTVRQPLGEPAGPLPEGQDLIPRQGEPGADHNPSLPDGPVTGQASAGRVAGETATPARAFGAIFRKRLFGRQASVPWFAADVAPGSCGAMPGGREGEWADGGSALRPARAADAPAVAAGRPAGRPGRGRLAARAVGRAGRSRRPGHAGLLLGGAGRQPGRGARQAGGAGREAVPAVPR